MSMSLSKKRRKYNMCAIFGLVNYRHFLSKKQLKTLVNRLAVASEVRGTDASGIQVQINN